MGRTTRISLLAAGAGLIAFVFGIGLAELITALLGWSSTVAGVGGWLIDLAPPWAKDTAIALFGTADKLALLVGIALVLAAVGAATGILEYRRPPWGRVLAGAIGVLGAVITATRPDAGVLDAAGGLIAAAATVLALALLTRRLPSPQEPADSATARTDRRRFLGWTAAAGAVGVLSAIGASAMRAGSQAVQTARRALTLPAPAQTAPPVPPGAELDVAGLSPLITPNADFYRIDTALVVPQVSAQDWSLRIHGLVENEVTVTWDELLALPLAESTTTLMCVSNTVGGDLIGNAVWLGYPIRELLRRAAPTADADMVLSRSTDGFTASTPLEALTDDRNAILAVGMNGDPLPAEHGFPVRMVVPGLYGYVSATKWVVELEVTRFDRARAYWTDRGWSERGPIKLSSRIDVPRASVPSGDTVIAGVAWQQHVGVSGVQVQVDDGPWQDAELAAAISADTWVQWSLPWQAEPGDHRIRCRAISATGQVQTERQAPPAPDGATGWDERTVRVN